MKVFFCILTETCFSQLFSVKINFVLFVNFVQINCVYFVVTVS